MHENRWATFARIRAQLDAGLDLEAVLAEARFGVATWMAAEEALLAELADDVERADFTGIDSYRRAYQATWNELTGIPLAPAALVDAVPIGQPADTTLIAPGLVVDNPLPFRPVSPRAPAPSLVTPAPPLVPAGSGLPFRSADPPTLPLTPGLIWTR
jgi:hypothetical protein